VCSAGGVHPTFSTGSLAEGARLVDAISRLDGVEPHHPEVAVRWDAPRPQRNRIQADVFVPHDQADPRIAAASQPAAGWSPGLTHPPVDAGRPRGQRGGRGLVDGP
jgi:hypothetical protein